MVDIQDLPEQYVLCVADIRIYKVHSVLYD